MLHFTGKIVESCMLISLCRNEGDIRGVLEMYSVAMSVAWSIAKKLT